MIIRGAKVFTESGTFAEEDLFIRNDRLVTGEEYRQNRATGLQNRAADLQEADEATEILDATGLFAIPGLVDIHFHGAVGHDFCDGDLEGLKAIAAYEASCGVTAICPATMTYSEEILNGVMENARQFAELQGRQHNRAMEQATQPNENGTLNRMASDSDAPALADLVGINMEGPFISPDKLGAQNPKYLHRPDAEMFARLQEKSGGLVKLCDIAPEVEGAMEFIDACKGSVTISLAHNNADYEVAGEAFRRGANHLTHLFNAMPGIHHRKPGPIIAAIEAGAEAELIADNIHVHPAMVRFAFKSFGADKLILISDSMEATGLADGAYQLGGQGVTKKGNLAVLTEHPETIAGSVTNLYDCMKTAVQVAGIPFADAVRAASRNPAISIGVERDYGSLKAGCYANVLLVDEDLNLKAVLLKGRMTKKSK